MNQESDRVRHGRGNAKRGISLGLVRYGNLSRFQSHGQMNRPCQDRSRRQSARPCPWLEEGLQQAVFDPTIPQG